MMVVQLSPQICDDNPLSVGSVDSNTAVVDNDIDRDHNNYNIVAGKNSNPTQVVVSGNYNNP